MSRPNWQPRWMTWLARRGSPRRRLPSTLCASGFSARARPINRAMNGSGACLGPEATAGCHFPTRRLAATVNATDGASGRYHHKAGRINYSNGRRAREAAGVTDSADYSLEGADREVWDRLWGASTLRLLPGECRLALDVLLESPKVKTTALSADPAEFA